MSESKPKDELEPSEDLLELIRVTVELPATLGEDKAAATITDIDRRGVYVAAERSWRCGERLPLSFRLADEPMIEAIVEVVWVKDKEGGGVKFVELDEASQVALNTFVRDKARALKQEGRLAPTETDGAAADGDG